MSCSNVTVIECPLAEASDYEVTATLYGPDGTTPVEPAAVSAIAATLRDLEANVVLFTDRDVLSSLSAGGVFVMPLSNTDTTATVARRFQRRLLTLKLTQTNGKMRKQEVRFSVENLTDVG